MHHDRRDRQVGRGDVSLAQDARGRHALRREPRRWRTRFGRWVEAYGVSRLALELSRRGQPVTPHAIYKWVSGSHHPRLGRAIELARLSRGAVGISEILRQRGDARSA